MIRRDKHFILAQRDPLPHFILSEILLRVQNATLWAEKNNVWGFFEIKKNFVEYNGDDEKRLK